LFFTDQCAAHLKNTFLSYSRVVFLQVQPLDLGIIHAFRGHCRKKVIHKTVAMIDEGLLQDASQMLLDVLSALHFIAETWRVLTPTTIKNYSG
jgi:hypothetical protein